MRLLIAEKPSVAREISKVLGKGSKGDGYIEHKDRDLIITWAYGHLLEQAEPEDYDPKYKRWVAEDLPIVPDVWKLGVKKEGKDQYKVVKGLLKEASSIINAGDPDREGQLLIDEILDYNKNKKPVERLLLNALDDKSIKDALMNLQDNAKFQPLKESALARSRADWLIGMNLSRAYTLAAQRAGNRITFPIGRVKTPTLALVVRREREIQNFKPQTYYVLKILYGHELGEFWTTWEPQKNQLGLDGDNHLIDRKYADELAAAIMDTKRGTVVKRDKKVKKEKPRLPYSLSSLQVVAGKLFHYDPQTVLDTVQKLYEKKLTSYPRSDCEYLPTSQKQDAPTILENLARMGDAKVALWVANSNLKLTSRAWNDSKITAHHAIIPTTVPCPYDKLTVQERNVYYLIAQAYIAQFYPDFVYEQTKIIVTQLEENFVANGKVIIDDGWKALYKRSSSTTSSVDHDADDEEKGEDIVNAELPAVNPGDNVEAMKSKIDQKETKPPTRFTTSTLVAAMKDIHKFVRNDNLKKQLKEVAGIGTEATRATIIDELIRRKFLLAKGKSRVLEPTEMAYMLIDALPEELTYPDETALWEERLARINDGEDSLASFLHDQVGFLTKLVEKASTATITSATGEIIDTQQKRKKRKSLAKKTGLTCPKCGKDLVERKSQYGTFYGCSGFPNCRYIHKDNPHSTNIMEDTTSAPMVEKKSKAESKKVTTLKKSSNGMYKCPRCLAPLMKEGDMWICSNKSLCRTSVADVDGHPSVYK